MIGQLESISCDVCGNPVREDQIHVIPDERTVCRRCYDEYHGRKRPEGCRFWDHRDVVVWIDENTEAIRDLANRSRGGDLVARVCASQGVPGSESTRAGRDVG